jgi:hypothetical protein
MQIVLPINISFEKWATYIQDSLPDIDFPLACPVEEWRSWAEQVVRNNGLRNVPLPVGQSFSQTENWKEWAAFFVGSFVSQKEQLEKLIPSRPPQTEPVVSKVSERTRKYTENSDFSIG